jgi:uncharacterized protein (DUF2345 family)
MKLREESLAILIIFNFKSGQLKRENEREREREREKWSNGVKQTSAKLSRNKRTGSKVGTDHEVREKERKEKKGRIKWECKMLGSLKQFVVNVPVSERFKMIEDSN